MGTLLHKEKQRSSRKTDTLWSRMLHSPCLDDNYLQARQKCDMYKSTLCILTCFSISDLKDAEVLVDFLYHLCETTAIRSVAASCLMKQISEAEKHYRNRKQSTPVKCCPSQSTPHVCSQEDRQQSESPLSLASTVSKDEEKTYLDFLMDFVTQNEFPEKIVTFMLHLLPSVSYKVSNLDITLQDEQYFLNLIHLKYVNWRLKWCFKQP